MIYRIYTICVFFILSIGAVPVLLLSHPPSWPDVFIFHFIFIFSRLKDEDDDEDEEAVK